MVEMSRQFILLPLKEGMPFVVMVGMWVLSFKHEQLSGNKHSL